MIQLRAAAFAVALFSASHFVTPSTAARTDSESLLGELLEVEETAAVAWKDTNSTSVKVLRQHRAGSAASGVGVWIHVQEVLNGGDKKALVSKALPGGEEGWFSWSLDKVGALGAIAGKIDPTTFMKGLSEQLKPQIQAGLKAKGIECQFSFVNYDESSASMLVSIVNIDEEKFETANLAMVRDGVIGSLTEAWEGIEGPQTLADQLAVNGVPGAEVAVIKKAGTDNELTIAIVAPKKAILEMALEEKLPEGLRRVTNMQWLTTAVEKIGPKLTKSSSIAEAMSGQIQKLMADQLSLNGIESDVTTWVSKKNGQKKDGKKVIAITVDVSIRRIDPNKFVKAKAVILRDAVVTQLSTKGPGGLEYELGNRDFTSVVTFRKCGWTGEAPPYPDKCDECSSCALTGSFEA